MATKKTLAPFAARVVRWQRRHGRHGLPWQGTRDSYRIWLSEVMLQQTQVATVLGYFERFTRRFPTVAELASATEEDVLALWSGLGYYARARNLHRAARTVMERFGGIFPTRYEDLSQLPGIGRSTAGAIAAFAAGERRAILDGNVRRVLARHAGIGGDAASAATLARLWSEAEARLPRRSIEAYTQGLMDLGADLCAARAPACGSCPVAGDCVARREDRVAELPGRRARAPVRRRQVAMLVVIRGGEVLLEKRPAAGIWGGLWSLPESPPDGDIETLVRDRFGAEDAHVTPLAPFQHAFTHFTLEVTPWRIDARRMVEAVTEPGTTWLSVDEIPGAALPSPVKRLLRRLAQGSVRSAALEPD
jgi:A/G-specific adenine glycosylase